MKFCHYLPILISRFKTENFLQNKKLKLKYHWHIVINFADHMRLIVFYGYLCLFLLAGRNTVYANPFQAKSNFSFTPTFPQTPQIKFYNPIKTTVLIQSDNINLDEEFHNNDDNHNGGVINKLESKKYNFSYQLCLKGFAQITSKEYVQRIKIFTPFCGYSNPIYIRQQVLRI